MATPIKWKDADFKWNDNPHTWNEVQLVIEIVKVISGGGDFEEEIYKYDAEKKKRLIKLTLKVSLIFKKRQICLNVFGKLFLKSS